MIFSQLSFHSKMADIAAQNIPFICYKSSSFPDHNHIQAKLFYIHLLKKPYHLWKTTPSVYTRDCLPYPPICLCWPDVSVCYKCASVYFLWSLKLHYITNDK